MRTILGLFTASFLFSISLSAHAFTNQLGPDASLVPYVEMPFVTSTLVKNTGERLPDGACRFPVDIELAPGMLQDNEVFVRVRRAVDPVLCEEVLEQGIALKPLPKAAQSTSDNIVQETLTIVSQGHNGSELSATASTNQEASGYIRYTDGRNPYMKPLVDNLAFWDGLTASEVYASISGEWSDTRSCPYPDTHWTVSRGTDYSFFWEEDDIDFDYIWASCDTLELDVNVKHMTEAENALLDIDCSDGAAITYNPITFSLDRSGSRGINSDGVVESGPFERCREYLVRYEVFE
ncbi:hypothetical protein [Marinobacter sp.]|uniref:hypothetical protein n=2 Tax=Gammaproteobacteria TaxID=1236 RepID=UPI003A8FC0F7